MLMLRLLGWGDDPGVQCNHRGLVRGIRRVRVRGGDVIMAVKVGVVAGQVAGGTLSQGLQEAS